MLAGLPISQRFFEEFNRKDILKEFGLKENLKTVIFFAGGRMGLARKNIFEYMKILADNSEKVQIVAISGKNEKAHNKFKEITKGKENVKVLEFTDRVPELMAIADLAITKPGGITGAECLVSNVPILVINPIPGQEEENAEYLEETGLAVWVKPKDDFETVFKETIKDAKLNKLKENGKQFANRNSAVEICENIFGKKEQ